MKNLICNLLLCLTVIILLSNMSYAAIYKVGCIPENPTVNDTISIFVDGGVTATCYTFDGHDFNIEGNTFSYSIYSHFNGTACFFLFSPWYFSNEIGQLPAGEYTVNAQETGYFLTKTFRVVDCSICNTGDLDGSDEIGITDLTLMVGYLFGDGEGILCYNRFDINGSSGIPEPTISDITYFVEYLFNAGPPPIPCE